VAATDESPYDFTVNPNKVKPHKEAIPSGNNFFSYYKIGDTAFVTFSGAHSYAEMKPQFQAACSWASSANPKYVLLQSHWNEDGYG